MQRRLLSNNIRNQTGGDMRIQTTPEVFTSRPSPPWTGGPCQGSFHSGTLIWPERDANSAPSLASAYHGCNDG